MRLEIDSSGTLHVHLDCAPISSLSGSFSTAEWPGEMGPGCSPGILGLETFESFLAFD